MTTDNSLPPGDSRPTPEEVEADVAEWTSWCAEHMREKEIAWTKAGYCYAWIDPEPTFCVAAHWSMLFDSDNNWAFPDPTTPGRRILRFSLLGGGQIRALECFRACRPLFEGFPSVWCPKIELKVTAHSGDAITTAIGEKYEGYRGEMNAQAVVLRSGRQDIADRVAATFRLINDEAANFFALLDGSTGCAICGRALRDEISKLIRVGPKCARENSVPHNREAAERRLALRRKLLHL
jgi:hypothetical protein